MADRLGHRPALDGVRALAVAGVIGYHIDAARFPGGFFGVDVFFVLSAFLITALIWEEVLDRGEFDYRMFYARRALRLGPALIFFLVFLGPAAAAAVHRTPGIPVATAVSLFYVSDFAQTVGPNVVFAYRHLWSLSVEEQFYAIWPALLVALLLWRPRGFRRRWLLVAFACAAIAATDLTAHLARTNHTLPTGHLIALAAGALAAYWFKTGADGRVLRWARSGAVAAVSVLALGLTTVLYRAMHVEPFELLQIALSGATVSIILHICRPRTESVTVLSSFLASAPVVWIGRRSYGLYLYHLPLVVVTPILFKGIQLRYEAVLVVAVSLAMAGLSFRLVEGPISLQGRAWLRRRQQAAPTRPALEAA